MNIIRERRFLTDDLTSVHVGDKLIFPLSNSSSMFKATLMQNTGPYLIFLSDECVDLRPIMTEKIDVDKFEQTDLYYWLNTKFLQNIEEDIRKNIHEISIPSYELMYSKNELRYLNWYNKYIIPDEKIGTTHYELTYLYFLNNPLKKIGLYKSDICEYWMSNKIEPLQIKNTLRRDKHVDIVSINACFSTVTVDGKPNFSFVNKKKGVRPLIYIKK